MGLDIGFDASRSPDRGLNVTSGEIVALAKQTVNQATNALAAYLTAQAPSCGEQADLAAHAVRLAKLDAVARAFRFDPYFYEAASEDIEELLALLSIVPFDALLHPRVIILNPGFGATSKLFGGADTDLITGDLLVDFKTTKHDSMQVRDLDQLLGYFLVLRHHRQYDPEFPDVKRLALYFSRQGYLWTYDASAWIAHPQFEEIEEWFLNRAKEENR
jgi:hypothetical protein